MRHWTGNGNDSVGMGWNGNNNSHSRTTLECFSCFIHCFHATTLLLQTRMKNNVYQPIFNSSLQYQWRTRVLDKTIRQSTRAVQSSIRTSLAPALSYYANNRPFFKYMISTYKLLSVTRLYYYTCLLYTSPSPRDS